MIQNSGGQGEEFLPFVLKDLMQENKL
jgi:hypothetical protein